MFWKIEVTYAYSFIFDYPPPPREKLQRLIYPKINFKVDSSLFITMHVQHNVVFPEPGAPCIKTGEIMEYIKHWNLWLNSIIVMSKVNFLPRNVIFNTLGKNSKENLNKKTWNPY